MSLIYLDYAATTPVDSRVIKAMEGCLGVDGFFGNAASSHHRQGWEAARCVEQARRQVARLIGAHASEITWTSGATESDNIALQGVMRLACQQGRSHLVTSLAEHKAVLDTASHLEKQGVDVTWLRPDASGRISLTAIESAVRPETALVSLMHVNNETGAVLDIGAVGQMLRGKGVLFHVDAAQSAGKLPLDLSSMPVDLMSLSAHKFYGPKGVGCLYVRKTARPALLPLMFGGGHERGLRPGTIPTHQVVGMGEAAALAMSSLDQESNRIRALRDVLSEALLAIPGVRINGCLENTVPGILNVRFSGMTGEALMMALPDLALSSGSACNSERELPSHVLLAMGLTPAEADASLRFSLGRFTTRADIDRAADMLTRLLGAAAL
jgi:cysteine desulfurase